MELLSELESFGNCRLSAEKEALAKDQVDVILERACAGLASKYRSRELCGFRTFTQDLEGVQRQISAYEEYLFWLLSKHSLLAKLDPLMKGIIDGHKALLGLVMGLLKDKLAAEEAMGDKVESLTQQLFVKCYSCEQHLCKKNIDRLKNELGMGFKDPFTYFILDLEEISRLEKEARLFLIKQDTEIQSLTEEEYILKLDDMHHNLKKTMYGMDKCIDDIMNFQEKLAEMHDLHQEEQNTAKLPTAELFSHEAYAFRVAAHFRKMIAGLEKKLKSITSKIVYATDKAVQASESSSSDFTASQFERLQQESSRLAEENKKLSIQRNSLEQQLGQCKARYRILEEEKQFLEQSLIPRKKKDSAAIKKRQSLPESNVSSKNKKKKKLSKNSSERDRNSMTDQDLEGLDEKLNNWTESRERRRNYYTVNTNSESNFSKKKHIDEIEEDDNVSETLEMQEPENQQPEKQKHGMRKYSIKNRDSFDYSAEKRSSQIQEAPFQKISKRNSSSIQHMFNEILSKPLLKNSAKKTMNQKSQTEKLIELYRANKKISEKYNKEEFISRISKFLESLTHEQLEKNSSRISNARLTLNKPNIRKARTKNTSIIQSSEATEKYEKRSEGKYGLNFDSSEKSIKGNMRKSADSAKILKIPELRRYGNSQENQSSLSRKAFNKTIAGFKKSIKEMQSELVAHPSGKNIENHGGVLTMTSTIKFTEKETQMLHLIDNQTTLSSTKSSMRMGSKMFKREPLKNIEESLTVQEIGFMNEVFALIAAIHTQDFQGYFEIKNFLLKSHEIIFKSQIKTTQSSNLMREGLSKLILLHRDCRKEEEVCKHLTYFLKKIRRTKDCNPTK